MKKHNLIVIAVTLAAFAFGMTSCGSGGPKAKSPAKIEMEMWEQMQKGNYDKAFDLWYDNVNKTEQEMKTNENKEAWREIFGKTQAEADQKQGISDVELIEETFSEDGTKATVKVKCTYGDGTTNESSSKYVLVDGKWMIDLGK